MSLHICCEVQTKTSSTYRFASIKKITISSTWFEFIDFPFFADKNMEGDTHPPAHISPSGTRKYNWLI